MRITGATSNGSVVPTCIFPRSRSCSRIFTFNLPKRGAFSCAGAGAAVTAVDVSEVSLQWARRRAETMGVGNISFRQADAEELSRVVPPEPYDLVYAFGVVHHTPRPERVMRQIRRHYTRPGSTVKVMVYHCYAWKVLWILLVYGHGAFWRLGDLVARYSEAE